MTLCSFLESLALYCRLAASTQHLKDGTGSIEGGIGSAGNVGV